MFSWIFPRETDAESPEVKRRRNVLTHLGISSAAGLGTEEANNTAYARDFLMTPDAYRSKASLLWRLADAETVRALVFGTIIGQYFLLFVIAIMLLAFGTLLWIYGSKEGTADYDQSLRGATWLSWGMFIDPGTQTGLAFDEDEVDKVIVIVLSILGFIFNLLFLGVVVENMRSLLDRLFARYSAIYARDHVIILGWTPKSLFLINEIMGMFEDNGGVGTIVVLGNRSKYSMLRTIELAFRRRQPKRPRRVRIRVWEGDPAEEDDLTRISINTARFVICLGESEDPRIADAQVIETLLSLQSLDPQEQTTGTVIAELRTAESRNVVRELNVKSDTLVLAVLSSAAIDAVLAQAALHPAVGGALIQLISFLGQNFIFLDEVTPYVGKTFGSIAFDFPDAVLCGVHTQGTSDAGKDRDVLIAPPISYTIRRGDRLLLIADDQSQIRAAKRRRFASRRDSGPTHLMDAPNARYKSLANALKRGVRQKVGALPGAYRRPETVIIIGWRSAREMAALVRALSRVLHEGSVIMFLSAVEESVRRAALSEETAIFFDKIDGMHVKHVGGSPLAERALLQLPIDVATVGIVLGDPTNIKTNLQTAEQEYSEGDARLRDARVFAVTTMLRALAGNRLHIVPVYSNILSFRLMARVSVGSTAAGSNNQSAGHTAQAAESGMRWPWQKRGTPNPPQRVTGQPSAPARNASQRSLVSEPPAPAMQKNDVLLVGDPQTTVFHRNALETGLIAMQANDPALNYVFNTVMDFDEELGHKMQQVLISDVVKLITMPTVDGDGNYRASFHDIAREMLELHGHVVVGYATARLQIVVNPAKKKGMRRWAPNDWLIILRAH